ncbi:16S rRNA methyltransferase RsmB/F-like protein 1 [Elsinoe fawcettii]|nr:16S rRNA methyltransferase RsmB/F-like protein 1 [Elsinoe fawcettii]
MVSKTDRKRSDAAIEAFHKYYSSPTHWNAQRWQESLFPALSRPVRYVMVINPFANATDTHAALEPLDLLADALASSPLHARVWVAKRSSEDETRTKSAGSLLPQPALIESTGHQNTKLLSHYNLDAASLLPVLLLNPQSGDNILDMCAAPGGKSIVMAQSLFSSGSSGSLHSNESHPARNTRLARNLASYFPPDLLSNGHIKTTKLDGTSSDFISKADIPSGQDRKGYDKVLLDAPCSSERHIIQSFVTAQRSGGISVDMLGYRTGLAGKKSIVKLQGELLFNAIKACRVGGIVVYSTCSIDRLENEGVVKNVMAKLAKGKDGFGVSLIDMDVIAPGLDKWSESCEVGRICLPDNGEDGRSHGFGPIYFCVLTKTAG